MEASKNCFCGSNLSYEKCCKPFHENKATPDTPEKLMRSRYSAYVVCNMDYIHETHDPAHREGFDREASEQWAKDSKWLGLEIISAKDDYVEFKAKYELDGKVETHHELSRFRFDPKLKKWFFLDGKIVHAQLKRDEKIVGRNDPCSCGSGKKYKKCCAA